MKSIFMILLTSLVVKMAHGGWTSGGGALIKDANNPWFLENVKTVRYCILVDDENFSADRDKIRSDIKSAISFWKEDLKSNFTIDLNTVTFGIGTQEFIEEECGIETDLRFQFGYLTKNQKKYLGDPKELVAIAVRTNYDHKTMKGRGFIYVSPDNGPNKFKVNASMDNNWANGKGHLNAVLVHELGHIFGIPHIESSSKMIMGEAYPESIITGMARATYLPPFFGYNMFRKNGICSLKNKVKEFFELDSSIDCIKIDFSPTSNIVKIFSGRWLQGIELEEPKLEKTFRIGKLKIETTSVISVWFPKGNEVRPGETIRLQAFQLLNFDGYATLGIDNNGSRKGLRIKMSPGYDELEAFENSYNSWDLNSAFNF